MLARRLRPALALYAVWSALFPLVSRVESLAATAQTQTANERLARLQLFVHDTEGQPVAARVRLAATSWVDRMRLQPGGELSALTTAGELELALRPGPYRIVVSRGLEWSLEEFEVVALAGARSVRRVALRHEVSLAGWRGAELHVHTCRSDDAAAHGGVTAPSLLSEGIELAAITDHNQIGVLEGALDAIAGAEITTWAPEIGHFNAFPLKQLPAWRGTNPSALLRELTRDPQLYVQVNHPRLDDHIAYFKLGGFDGLRFREPNFHLRVHGLEVWNGYDLAAPERVRALLVEWRRWIARGERLTATGGSDSHGATYHLPGYPRTYTRARHAGELATELRAGRAFVTNGPLLELSVDGRLPGDTAQLVASKPALVELRVRAPSWLDVDWLELWADDRLAWSRRIPRPAAGQPLDYQLELALMLPRARVLTAVAHGGGGLERLLGRNDVEPLAFTNAVRLTHTAHPKHASER